LKKKSRGRRGESLLTLGIRKKRKKSREPRQKKKERLLKG